MVLRPFLEATLGGGAETPQKGVENHCVECVPLVVINRVSCAHSFSIV